MRYDLVIVGGGLVGASLALALRDKEVRVALVDARLPSCDDPRLFALNDSSCRFLSNLGLWDTLRPHACPIHQVHVSQLGSFGVVRLKREDVLLQSLGYVIPAFIIESVLYEALNQLTNLTIYRPMKLKTLCQQTEFVTVTLTENGNANEIILQAPFLVGADGTDSIVRAQSEIETSIFDYQQKALVTRTKLKRSHQHVAYERFTKDGAIAMLPLPENECATIWTAATEKITELMQEADKDFLFRLQKEFGYRLGELQSIKQRHTFPLRMVRAKKSFADRVFLLGNSAHTLSPIAAQGFNLALYEVAVLAEEITETLVSKKSLDVLNLQSVANRIEKQQAKSIGVSHRLSQYMGGEKNSLLMSLAMQLGMLALDASRPVKKKFIRDMLGQCKEMPALLLSEK